MVLVLKFCQWGGADASAERPRDAWSPTGQGGPARRGSSSIADEFTVDFHGRSPVGLGFRQAPPADASALECVVSDVLPDSQAAEHNAWCRATGDVSRLLTAGAALVSRVNGRDVRGVPYLQVLQRMREAKPEFSLSFAHARRAGDSREKRVAAKSFALKAKKDAAFPRPSSPPSVGGRRRMSTIAVRDLGGSPRHSVAVIDLRGSSSASLTPAALPSSSTSSSAAAVALRRRNSSSFLALHGGLAPEADSSAAGVLVNDLEHENEDMKQQLEAARARMAEEQQQQERRRQEQEQQQEREAREAREALEQITKARDDMVAVNRVLLSQQRLASKSHRLALERERQDAEAARAEAQALQQQMEELQHEKAAVTRRWQELQDEHRDAARHAEELHERLIEAQREASDARSRAGDDDIDDLSDADEDDGADDEDDSASELSRVLRFERRRSTSDAGGADGGSRRPSGKAAARRESWQRRNSSPTLAVSAEDAEELGKQRAECQRLREQVAGLEFASTTTTRMLSAVQDELREATEREQAALSAHASQLGALEEAARLREVENDGLRRTLEQLRAEERASLEAKARDAEFLAQFKQHLARGVTLTKYGARGVPHARVVYADPACRWLSWRAPAANLSLQHPRPDARVDTSDLVGVVAGATTDVFLRQAVGTEAASAAASPAATTCLSLVMLNPCRTLDLQADSADQCRGYLRGFRLLCAEAAAKRQRLLLGAPAADAGEPPSPSPSPEQQQPAGRRERALSAAELQQQPNYF